MSHTVHHVAVSASDGEVIGYAWGHRGRRLDPGAAGRLYGDPAAEVRSRALPGSPTEAPNSQVVERMAEGG